MLNNYMEVGRGSTRGRRRGLAGPAARGATGVAGTLAITWEGSMGDLVWPGHVDTEEESNNSFVTDLRRAITWEGPLEADKLDAIPEDQVNIQNNVT